MSVRVLVLRYPGITIPPDMFGTVVDVEGEFTIARLDNPVQFKGYLLTREGKKDCIELKHDEFLYVQERLPTLEELL